MAEPFSPRCYILGVTESEPARPPRPRWLRRLAPTWLRWTWMDLLWLVFLAGLAVLPPIREIHKQLILLSLALFQLFEGRLLELAPRQGARWDVVVKIALATLLIGHTGQVAINSSYYPIFFVPVVTAAMLFGPWGTLAWTAVACAAYCSYLLPALRHYRLDPAGLDELALRVFFFFLLAMIVNRFVVETEHQRELYRQAQASARRAERLAALGQLSAGLAHEIRNPLAVIRGSAEMLQKELAASSAVAVELAGYISSEVNRVSDLVARFLDFARPLRLQLEATALLPLLERAVADARERWPDAAVEVERHFFRGFERLSLPLDATLMERAFSNLVANAFEAMQPGGGVLRLHAARRGGELSLSFQDTGPGVPAELRDQIFNPFFTTKPSGVGLGLAIVAKIVDQHGGQLRLLPAAGAGAVFEIVLPAPA